MIHDRLFAGMITRVFERDNYSLAWVKPLAVSSATKERWEIDLTCGDTVQELLPNRGLVSWFNPHEKKVGALWLFELDEQPSYDRGRADHDKYGVRKSTVKRIYPVLDLDKLGGDHHGRRLISRLGVHISHGSPLEYIIRTEKTLWSSPIELTEQKDVPGRFSMPLRDDGTTIWQEMVPKQELFGLSGIETLSSSFAWSLLPPNQTVSGKRRLRDWSPDEQVLQHLLRTLRRCNRAYTDRMNLTKAAVGELASVLSNGAAGINDKDLETARLKRVQEYIESLNTAEEVSKVAMAAIVESPIADEIEKEKQSILDDAIKDAKGRAEAAIVEERAELEKVRQDGKRMLKEYRRLETAYKLLQQKRVDQLANLDQQVSDRLNEVLDNAEEIVSSAAIIRSISGNVPRQKTVLQGASGSVTPDRAPAREISDILSAVNSLKGALINRDLPMAMAEPLTTAFLSGLTPVLGGEGANAAVEAFAEVFAAGQLTWIPVSPGWIDTSDFLGKPHGEERNHPSGLLEVLKHAESSTMLHVVILDGINLAPCETFLQPLLSAKAFRRRASAGLPVIDATDVSLNRVHWPENVLLAGTVSSNGQFPVPDSVLCRSAVICCDAFDAPIRDVKSLKHPDGRHDGPNTEISSVARGTWETCKSLACKTSLEECVETLRRLKDASRAVRDSAMRFFAAWNIRKETDGARLATTAFALLPHLDHGAISNNDLPEHYDKDAACQFIRMLRGSA